MSNLQEVYKNIGVCPQFDLLWEELTVEEHLLFYLRLKGCSAYDEYKKVEDAVSLVKLTEDRYKKVRQLSGGMKRRLSLAIAIVGEPLVVFLDEPTTGLDPKNRIKFWETIEQIKKDKAIILTTHIMEEADVVSDRIGIINKGSFMCLGTQSKLKESYGQGFLFSGVFKKVDHRTDEEVVK